MENTITPFRAICRCRILILTIFSLISFADVYSQVLYVNKAAAGANNGSSWTNAYPTITAAVTNANADVSIKEIRIAGGTYQENELIVTGRYNLSGYWNPAINSIDIATPTVLDGQLLHRIMTIEAGAVVKLSWLDFKKGGITGNVQYNGGGIHNKGYLNMDMCNITECSIPYTPYIATGHGGGIFNEGTLELTNTKFENNSAGNSGGALANFGSTTITSCTFNNNSAESWGGAINHTGRMKVFRSRFTGNYIWFQGGPTIHNGEGGAICNRSSQTGATDIVNCIFDKNKALSGGAIGAGYDANITNNTFYANEAYVATQVRGFGGAIYIRYGCISTVFNNVFKANLAKYNDGIWSDGASSSMKLCQIKNNLIEFGQIQVNTSNSATADIADNIYSDPLFLDPENGNFNMLPMSLALNTANNDHYVGRGFPGVDYQGLRRFSPCNLDMGAIEFQYPNFNPIVPDNDGVLYVNINSSYAGIDLGRSWDNALNSLKLAMDFANLCPSVREIRVAEGLYKEDNMTLSGTYDIRGGFDAASGEQNWALHLTILEKNTTGRILYISAGAGTVKLEGCWLRSGDGGIAGGAILNDRNLQVSNCRFLFNKANSGGAIYHRAGNLFVISSEFLYNEATDGGAVYAEASATITNCSFNNNTAFSQGIAFYNNTGVSSNLYNNIVWGANAGQVFNAGNIRLDRNIIRGAVNGTVTNVNGAAIDQLDADPLFSGATELSIKPGSPAINKGSNDLFESADGDAGNFSVGKDRDNSFYTRVYDDVIDLGSNERQAKQQVIAVTDQTATYGDVPFDPNPTSNSNLPFIMSSSDNSIAQPMINPANLKPVLVIYKKGTITVSAWQPAFGEYDASPVKTFTFTVNPKPVTVTADAVSKTYGDDDPVLTYTVAPALVPGDAFSGALSRAAGENVGAYAVAQNDLALSDNYVISYTGADFTINKKTITVTADASGKTYGDADPALTYTHTPALAFTDAFSSSLLRVAGEHAGVYTIQQGSLALNSNYDIVFNSNDFVIAPKNIAVAAENRSKIYGQTDPPLTFTVTPALLNNDVLSGSLARTPGEQAGVYPIAAGSLAHPDYTISFTGAQFTIDKASQQISWTQALVSDCNGGTVLTLNASSNSGLTVNYQSSNTSVATVNGNLLTFVTPGVATITAIQSGDVNYLAATNVMLDLTSRLPAYLIKKHWDDVLVFDNSSKQYTAWQWFKNDQPVSNATGQYYHESGKLNGNYYATAKNANGIALPTCPVTLTPGTTVNPVTVVPNPVRVSQQVTAKISFTQAELTGAVISVLNVHGIEVGLVQNVTPDTRIAMPAFGGVYVVKLRLATGATYSTNVLVKP